MEVRKRKIDNLRQIFDETCRPVSLIFQKDPERIELLEIARKIHHKRNIRTCFFSPVLFGEPAWDILLVLYIEQDRSFLSMSELVAGSSTARATALRWTAYLEREQLIESLEGTDKRFRLMRMTLKGRSAMNECLRSLRAENEKGPC